MVEFTGYLFAFSKGFFGKKLFPGYPKLLCGDTSTGGTLLNKGHLKVMYNHAEVIKKPGIINYKLCNT